jgi:hypothetical protein
LCFFSSPSSQGLPALLACLGSPIWKGYYQIRRRISTGIKNSGCLGIILNFFLFFHGRESQIRRRSGKLTPLILPILFSNCLDDDRGAEP